MTIGLVDFRPKFNYSAFYSFVRLKEQEIRNLVWICECIVQVRRRVVCVICALCIGLV